MNKFISAVAVFAFIVTGQICLAAEISCSAKDAACREFSKFTAAGQFEKLIARVDAKKIYSDNAKGLIGQAYLMLANKEGNTPEQKEQLCLKALEYGAAPAYMGLYFIYTGKDPEKALGFLKQYIATQPQDSAPYVLLGESEMKKKNYQAANTYLREARKAARGRSNNLDWMQFQTSYLTGDYRTASSLLESSFAQGKTVGDLKALISDPRFSDIGKRSEFKKFFPMINGTSTAGLYTR